jgi:hypothetical protein
MKKAHYLYFLASILFMASGIIRLVNGEGGILRGILFLVASFALLLAGVNAMRKTKDQNNP